MEMSLFLAKVIGLYLIIVLTAILINRRFLDRCIDELVESPCCLISTGALAVILGLLIVISHNVWTTNWPVVITIIGWLALIKGVLRLYWPQQSMDWIRNFRKKPERYTRLVVAFLIIGLWLTYIGFTQ
ncbi:MAG: hypothetical protein KDK65_05830 [Chlamydiia bacterium]|nr:hypothetical protein [Chlamydiia bacterium]